ncbi:hypothetical protein M569_08508, partial [Genlisea aurea]
MTGGNEDSATRVLFCGPNFPGSHNYTQEYLQSHPSIVVDIIPFDAVPDVIGNYDICVSKDMKITSNIIARAGNRLKLIMQFGVGIEGMISTSLSFFFFFRSHITQVLVFCHEGIDVGAATKHGIKVGRIPSDTTGNASSCAEMAIYLMMGLLRKQNEMQASLKKRSLGYPIGDTLLGKTVFILGYGNIGKHLAKRLRPFGVKIVATKRSWYSPKQGSFQSDDGSNDDLVDVKGVHEDIVKYASISDIVVCCLSMSSETAGIVDDVFVSSMKKGSLLVNISRGGLLDYDAVVKNLESGHLGGLAIDVAWREPFEPDDAVLKFPNVIVTPHVAGVTECSYRAMAKV